MNFAYRYFERTDWFPSIYGFCDVKTLENKIEELRGLVARHPDTTFYAASEVSQLCLHNTRYNRLRIRLSKAHPFFNRVFRLDRFRRTVTVELPSAPNLLPIAHGPTGVGLSQVLIDMGIQRILLIGADADYVEKIPEAEDHPDDGHLTAAYRRLIITSDVHNNPNYFFNDYQRVGDVYSTPRAATSHIQGWEEVAQLADEAGVEVINCSPTSRIRNFKRRSLKECLDELL